MKQLYRLMALEGLLIAAGSIELFAASSGSLFLMGTLAKKSSVTVNPSGSASTLDLTSTSGASDLLVASITEVSNAHLGYTVTIISANAKVATDKTKAVFKGQTWGETLEYTIKYGGVSVSLVNGEALVTNASGRTTGITKDVTITYNAGPNLAADTYADTLTVTIADK